MVEPLLARPSRVLLTPSSAWLRRVARVTSRKGEVWARSDGQVETIVVIHEPQLAGDWHGGVAFMTRLANIVSAMGHTGWCHEVFCLETGKRYCMNEGWFSDSERALLNASYMRLA